METALEYQNLLELQRCYHATGQLREEAYRKALLERLYQGIKNHSNDIKKALKDDLGKSDEEAFMTEIGMALSTITYYKKHLHQLMARKKVKSSLAVWPAHCYRQPEAYGCVLIIAPWNYPFLLCLDPLIAALAAGNCAVVKPSELAPCTAQVVNTLISECFEPKQVACVCGDGLCSQNLLQLRFDYIFYTGSPRIGRLVMEAAAKHLTPVTLELGGKSPAIIDKTAKIDLCVKRLLFGKITNAGQTCVAPDYLLVEECMLGQVIERFNYYTRQFLGKNPLTQKDYPHIVNETHFARLVAYLNNGVCLCGGQYDAHSLRIVPTLLQVTQTDCPIMQEEIFGPIMPVLTFKQQDEALSYVKKGEKPLALYLFSEDRAAQKRWMEECSFGGACINDTLMHLATPTLPFGGVGNSGMGSYHGKAGFDTFTHYKSILNRSTRHDPSFRYPPFSILKMRLIKFFLR